jgi:predicted N-formylglutamate amidohydrolase
MNDESIARLLLADERPPVTVLRAGGRSHFVLICDHASRDIPRTLNSLHLSEPELSTHIAWDIGAARIAQQLSDSLDAVLILQNYSRLVIDCNRPLAAPDSIPISSENTAIDANRDLDAAQREARRAEIFAPYHDMVRTVLDQRHAEGRPSILVAVHSFTPSYRGVSRPWHVGLMHRRDARFAAALCEHLRREPHLVVGDNEPYAISDASDYTIPTHAEARGLAHVGIEIRQDQVGDRDGQNSWAERLARLLPLAL